jgi:hypothetical protein
MRAVFWDEFLENRGTIKPVYVLVLDHHYHLLLRNAIAQEEK